MPNISCIARGTSPLITISRPLATTAPLTFVHCLSNCSISLLHLDWYFHSHKNLVQPNRPLSIFLTVCFCSTSESSIPRSFYELTKMSKVRALWQASLTATKRALTWNIDDMLPPSERFIYNFNSKEELKKWHLYSDSEYGGLSSAALEINDAGNERIGPGVFSGNLSLDVTEGTKWNISRSGFCGMRSKKFDGFIDLDPYDSIALKVKGDGRSYISTIYTENWVNSPGQMEDNSWQAFVCVPKDNWVVAKIPLAHYLPTWRGNVIEADIEMNPSRVVGMSLSVNAEGGVPGTETGPGDFRLEIDWIKALRTE